MQLIKVEASGAKTSFLNRGAGMELFLNVIGIYIDAKLDFFLQLEKNSAFPEPFGPAITLSFGFVICESESF